MRVRNTKSVVDTSKVVKAHSKKSDAIRTTIPAGVRNAMSIKEGDVLIWKVLPRGDMMLAEVRKAEHEEEEAKKEE